jgi:hypothetical protein
VHHGDPDAGKVAPLDEGAALNEQVAGVTGNSVPYSGMPFASPLPPEAYKKIVQPAEP